MVEVIKRRLVKEDKDGAEVWKVWKLLSERFNKVQVSYNDFGHLVLRLWYEDEECIGDEVLIVFNRYETTRIHNFVKFDLR
ncbi:hypothetical protein VFC49_09255 [Thermococcus sp. SY098]|uniref:hypothetical protein n=1 Tax=Thermococcus sp. SY098 TaxID=3111325 RepID=UPI002D79A17D|nr:hypothetical protein [Thermococcus sp. SY098]WRS52233.1 hypothetical protein VFC49_09255 [Thermococcus sp. SY098]